MAFTLYHVTKIEFYVISHAFNISSWHRRNYSYHDRNRSSRAKSATGEKTREILSRFGVVVESDDVHERLRSTALLPTVMRSPWYTLYAKGRDSDLIATISLTRASFDLLLSKFKLFYKFKSGPSKSGRPPRVRDHHCVLSLLLQ